MLTDMALPYRTYICRCVMLSYPRRLLVVYLTLKAMRRPLLMNNQHEVCAFCMYEVTQQGGAVGGVIPVYREPHQRAEQEQVKK